MQRHGKWYIAAKGKVELILPTGKRIKPKTILASGLDVKENWRTLKHGTQIHVNGSIYTYREHG